MRFLLYLHCNFWRLLFFRLAQLVNLLGLLFLAVALSACGGGSSGENSWWNDPTTTTAILVGHAQTGSYLSGGSVNSTSLADQLHTTSTTITNDLGTFGFSTGWYGWTTTTVSGAYYDVYNNSNTVDTSNTLFLSAFHYLSNGTNLQNINLFTHFIAVRSQLLISNGSTEQDAKTTAQRELNNALGGTISADLLDLTDASENFYDNANLLAFFAAFLAIGGDNDDLQILVDDFTDDGLINGKGVSLLTSIGNAAGVSGFINSLKTNLLNQGYSDVPSDSDLMPRPDWFNEAPVADAGIEQTVDEQTVVTLDGNGSSDSDGSISSYEWVETSSHNVTISNADTDSPSFTAPVVTYESDGTGGVDTVTLQLTVTDNEGSTHTDTVTITVNAVNALPTTNAGIDQSVNEQTSVTLNGIGSSDSDGNIETYLWEEVTSTNVVLSSDSAAQPIFTTPVVLLPDGPLSIIFRLTATDNEGGSTSDTVTITVNPVNIFPTASISASSILVDEGSVITLTGSGADADGNIASYNWGDNSSSGGVFGNTSDSTVTFTAPSVTFNSDGSGGTETVTLQLTVTDNEGSTGISTITITVNAVNATPTADASVDQNVNEQTLVSLDGSNSLDSDGSIATYLWEETTSTNIVLSSDSAAQPTFTAPTVLLTDGTLTLSFKLTITDNEGSTDTDTVTVTVNPVNATPISEAGATQNVNEQTSVMLDGSGSSDSDGNIKSYLWEEVTSTNVTLSDSSLAQPTFTAPVVLLPDGALTITFRLTVTDNEDESSTDTVTLTVNPVNASPTADAGIDQSVDEQTLVTLDGGASDDSDGNIKTYLWEELTSTNVVLSDSAAIQPTFTTPTVLESSGSLTIRFRLTVTDNEAVSNTDTVTITVNPVNVSPTVSISASSTSVSEGAAITLTGTASDNDGNIVSYRWSDASGSGGTFDSTINQIARFTTSEVRFNSDGSGGSETVTLLLTVTDNEGATETSSVTVTVNAVNVNPTADADTDQSVNEQTVVTLDGSGSSDSDGNITSYLWEEVTSTGVTLSDSSAAQPSFSAPAVLLTDGAVTIRFRLTVIDEEGSIDTDTVTVTVNPVNSSPTANAGSNQSVNEQTVVTLDGSGSSDSDGNIKSYLWEEVTGTGVSLSSTNVAQPTFNAPARLLTSGSLVISFRLIVSDNENIIDTDTVTITVNPVNVSPTADAGIDQSVNERSVVTLDGSSSTDDDGSINRYFWEEVTSIGITLSDSSAVKPTFSAPAVLLTSGALTITLKLTVTDNEEVAHADTVTITVNPVNTTPTADAGVDQTVDEQTMVTLDGSASSDGDGSISSYLWEEVTSTNVVLSNSNAIQPTFTAPSVLLNEGSLTLTFRLTVTDNELVSDSDTVTITIDPINTSPVANAGTDQTVNEQTVVTLDGSTSSDDDGSIKNYLWEEVTSTGVVLSDSSAGQPTFSAPVVMESNGALTLTFRLTVTDNEGTSSTDTVTITVNPVNVLPTVSISSAGSVNAINEDSILSLYATANDSDGSIASYQWSVSSGSGAIFVRTDTVVNYRSPAVASDSVVEEVQLVVTDNEEATATTTFEITVNSTNTAPVSSFNVSATTVAENTVITLTSTSTDSDGDNTIASYYWADHSGSGGVFSGITGPTVTFTTPSVTFNSNGSGGLQNITFFLRVTDDRGISDGSTVVITVNAVNTLPTAVITASSTVLEGDSLSLSAANSTDSDGSVVAYAWSIANNNGLSLNFDDASSETANLSIPSVTADTTITLQLIVTDNENGDSTAVTKTVTIYNLPSQPQNVSASPRSTQVTLSWDSVSDATGYEICQALEDITLPESCLSYNGGTLHQGISGNSHTITGLTDNTQYHFVVIPTNSHGDGEASVVVRATPAEPAEAEITGLINDTGITGCSDYAFDTSGIADNRRDCSSTTDADGDPVPQGQDAYYGRDVTLDDDTDGDAGFSFSKIDDAGYALDAEATSWSCVKDNVTGLIWEVKADDGGLRDKGDTYTWYNSDSASNGDNSGTADDTNDTCDGYDSTDSATYCNTEAYVTRFRAEGLCGATTAWRLPTINELDSINNIYIGNSAIDSDFFPNVVNSFYWSSTPSTNGLQAWVTDMTDGEIDRSNKSLSRAIRLVRGE